MKKLLLCLLFATFVFPAYSKVMIGTVDIQKVLHTVDEGAQVLKKLRKVADAKGGILRKEEAKIGKEQKAYMKQRLVMNEKARMKKEKDLQQMIMNFQKKNVSFNQEIQKMEVKYRRPLEEKVKVIIEQVSKSSGVDVTFESRVSPIMYAKSKKDLTDDVIKMYNKKHPVKK